MFPRRRRDRDESGEDPFRELEEELENIARMFEDMRDASFEELRSDEPYVYGFSVRIGHEGKPSIEEFGNMSEVVSGQTLSPGEIEPLTDIIEGDKDVSVIVELPGVDKKDINLKTEESSLEIKVDTPKRRYHKRLALPCRVKPETAKVSYNNGVLEVRIERARGKEKE